MTRQKLLFICRSNVSRSRTAEDMFRNSVEYEVQSAGIDWHKAGRQMVSQGLINWANRIFVMEKCHLEHLYDCFDMEGKEVKYLGIPDEYSKGSPDLVNILKLKLADLGVSVN